MKSKYRSWKVLTFNLVSVYHAQFKKALKITLLCLRFHDVAQIKNFFGEIFSLRGVFACWVYLRGYQSFPQLKHYHLLPFGKLIPSRVKSNIINNLVLQHNTSLVVSLIIFKSKIINRNRNEWMNLFDAKDYGPMTCRMKYRILHHNSKINYYLKTHT